jgi:hypothetical protein
MTKIVYIVGEPGVGKSTLMDRLTEPYQRHILDGQPRREQLRVPPSPAQLLSKDIGPLPATVGLELGCRAGKHPEGYPGTDAMSMTAIVGVDRWLRETKGGGVPVILGEGARLGVKRLVDTAIELSIPITVCLIKDERRAADQRAARGSMQNESWIKGARTRAERFWHYAAQRACRPNQVSAVLWQSWTTEEMLHELRHIAGL